VLPDGNSWTDYGIPALDTFIARGNVVVATDYQGLGGGGDHQYSVAVTNARDTIDAIRAVGAMGLTGSNRSAIIYGWSQGGGAAIAAASMPDYLNKRGTAFDGIDLRGVVALAPQDVAAVLPRVELDDADAARVIQGISQSFSNNIFNFAHFAMTIWATVASTPGLQMSDIFTDEGAREMDHLLRRKCMHVLSDTMSFAYGTNYRSLLRDTPVNGPAWVRALLAGSVPPVKPVAPVAIYFGSADVTVPPAMGAAYRRQMCAMGGNVARTQLPGTQSHFTTPGASQAMYVEWVADRLAGRPAANGCAD
jgi:pimeloyl-ACP methyl ester carboxylesterase